MTPTVRALAGVGVLWLALVAVALATRPLLPVDETRYLTAAWEMWLRGDLLVPTVNFEPYTRKPPLLFWLIQAGWSVVGVSELWGRIVSPLFGLVSLGLVAWLARRLWPREREAAALAPAVLLGSAIFLAFGTLTMFDTMLTAWILVAFAGLLDAWRRGGVRGWLLFGVAGGLGILTKGPVVLVHVLPVALLAPLWVGAARPRRWRDWYGGIALGVAVSAAIGLAWAIPAAMAGGEAYANEILLRQTLGRLTGIKTEGQIWKTHSAPVWWYLPLLPLVLAPWIWWPPAWRAFGRLRRELADPGVRFCLVWVVGTFVLLSLVRGKQVHYLLPLIAGAALLTARALAGARLAAGRRDLVLPTLALAGAGAVLIALPALYPWASEAFPEIGLPGFLAEIVRRLTPAGGLLLMAAAATLILVGPATATRQVAALTLASGFAFAVIHLEAAGTIWPRFDLGDLAAFIAEEERAGRTPAWANRYDGQVHFLGRLTGPIEAIPPDSFYDWAKRNPGRGMVQFIYGDLGPGEAFVFAYPYLGGWAAVHRPPVPAETP